MSLVTINLMGYLATPDAAPARLTGLSTETLGTARFVSLLELANRPAAGEMIEAVIGDGMPRTIDTALLVNRGDPQPVRIGFSAIRHGLVVSALCAVIAPSTRPVRETDNRA